MIFKNFVCPNGLPPDECRHVPQIINNLASYFVKKELAEEVALRDTNNHKNHQQTQNSQANRTRTRG